jgi:hypothetical protein
MKAWPRVSVDFRNSIVSGKTATQGDGSYCHLLAKSRPSRFHPDDVVEMIWVDHYDNRSRSASA